MPENEAVQQVRKKYGINNEIRAEKESENGRNFDRERTVLVCAIERIARAFQKQLAQGDLVLENDSRFVEEFCTLIELCIQHGWKSKIRFGIYIYFKFNGIYVFFRVEWLFLGCFGELREEESI